MLCKNILVAEDNTEIRETIVEVLQNEGYQVTAAENGQAALEALATLPAPTLVLLDLMMPVMNGWEFLDAQKAQARIEPHQVVVMSALPATRTIEDSTPLETAANLSKPLDLENLLATARRFCEAPVAQTTH